MAAAKGARPMLKAQGASAAKTRAASEMTAHANASRKPAMPANGAGSVAYSESRVLAFESKGGWRPWPDWSIEGAEWISKCG
eukprot:169848-Pyramimonas_sp.AAC.1